MAQKTKVKAAVIGCGSISHIYIQNLTSKFSIIDLVGCSDLIPERAKARAEEFGIRQMTNAEILNDPEIEIIMNLTFPEAHYEVSKAALTAGKHVCVEKMVTGTLAEAKELMDLANQKGLYLCTAPDTFLGGGWQTARKYLDDGMIGKPVSFNAVCTIRYQPDTPHFDIDPDHFFFPLHRAGGVPFDLGGYYLHTLINFFGSVKRVSGFGGTIDPDRLFTNPHHPKYGEPFKVETTTSIAGTLEFDNGVFGTVLFSSDSNMYDSYAIQGTDGAMMLYNPNFYSGDITLRRVGSEPVKMFGPKPPQMPQRGPFVRAMPNEYTLPMLHGYLDNCRGIGLADLAYALRNSRRPRMHGDLGYHSIEIIHGLLASCKTGQAYNMTSRCEQPKPFAPTALIDSAQEVTLDDA